MNHTSTRTSLLVIAAVVGMLLTACGNSAEGPKAPSGQAPSEQAPSEQTPVPAEPSEPPVAADQTTQTMVDSMLAKIEQPSLMDAPAGMVADLYHLDTALLEQFTIRMPMMNVKTNEIAILQVKDAKDIPLVEDAVKQRAADVQKQFENYLPDQYENAKNYKLINKENYVLFVISDQADELVNEFNSFFE